MPRNAPNQVLNVMVQMTIIAYKMLETKGLASALKVSFRFIKNAAA